MPTPHSPAVVGTPSTPRACGPLRLATAVMFVSDLDRSVDFYRELLGWDVAIEDNTVALLVSPEGFQMYLHHRGPRAQHPLGQIGVQYLVWAARDEDELHRCRQLLHATSSHVVTTTSDGFTTVAGRDPDQVPILVTYPGAADAPRHQILRRVYAW